MIEAKIIADSINPVGDRITTWVLTYPRFIHSEIMTHRVFSRNAASSRAIPVQKMIDNIETNPATPIHWGKNQKGMQAEEELTPELQSEAAQQWLAAAKDAIKNAKALLGIGVHKQIANRLLEPFAHMTTLLTGTEFENFFGLRAHKDAQPEFRALAEKMLALYNESTPTSLAHGGWHIPFGDQMPTTLLPEKLKIATARAARVSYLTFEGKIDKDKDFELHDDLADNGHWSPFEHCAYALDTSRRSGNFVGWEQYRKLFQQENRKDNRVIKKTHC